MGLRIKGQDCLLAITGPSGPEFSLARFKSFEINFLGEILTEEYIGDEAPEFDDIAMGIEVKAMLHPNDPAVFDFITRVEARRRRRPGFETSVFSSAGLFAFPGAGKRRVIVPNLFFGDLPMKVSGRKEYVGNEITAKASTFALKKAA